MNDKAYDYRQRDNRDYGFAIGGLAIGFVTGACVGAGLALWFAPRAAAELRERVTDSARNLGQRVSEGYGQVTSRVANVATEVTRQGQDVRDDVADVVAQGAHEVERFAKAAKTR
jgi:gas vesicle protein